MIRFMETQTLQGCSDVTHPQSQLPPVWSEGRELGLILKPEHLGAPRYERKFLSWELSAGQLEHLVRLHPAMFSKVYPWRFVNNIYLDTPALDNYRDNVVGSRNRLKMRVRWYGEQFDAVAKPVLELKLKDGLVGWKAQYRLASFDLRPGFGHRILEEVFRSSSLPAPLIGMLKRLEPVLLNRYRRRYYLAADRRYRITVDSDLDFRRLHRVTNSLATPATRLDCCTLELKYAPEYDLSASEIAGRFPLRVSKNSKYVSGMDALGLW